MAINVWGQRIDAIFRLKKVAAGDRLRELAEGVTGVGVCDGSVLRKALGLRGTGENCVEEGFMACTDRQIILGRPNKKES
jgi:hypothetical protein